MKIVFSLLFSLNSSKDIQLFSNHNFLEAVDINKGVCGGVHVFGCTCVLFSVTSARL